VLRFASSPISDLERLCVRDVLLTDQGSRRFLLDGFMNRWFDAFGAKLRKPTEVALIRQPWSYLRLEAYSFFGYARGYRVHLETRC
jgi:hypothetical protein